MTEGERVGVYIGRFQPPHRAHLQVMLEALSQVDRLVVILGSARSARSVKNPFTASERQQLVRAALQDAGVDAARVQFAAVRDFWDMPAWLTAVREQASRAAPAAQVMLFGHEKDASSAYLRALTQWTFSPTTVRSTLSATPLRAAWLSGHWEALQEHVPESVLAWLRAFASRPEYAALQQEAQALQAWQTAWASSPQRPVFVSSHALIHHTDAVLLVQRSSWPGRGLWQLPGGLLHDEMTLSASALRHVHEQTGLQITYHGPETTRIFDHPDRSPLGRELAHVQVWRVGEQSEPKPSSRWCPLPEALGQPEMFFADHYRLLELLLGPAGQA